MSEAGVGLLYWIVGLSMVGAFVTTMLAFGRCALSKQLDASSSRCSQPSRSSSARSS